MNVGHDPRRVKKLHKGRMLLNDNSNVSSNALRNNSMLA